MEWIIESSGLEENFKIKSKHPPSIATVAPKPYHPVPDADTS